MPHLYIHIPFCETKCIYCDFYSVESTDEKGRFLEALLWELEERAGEAGDTVFESVFLGGGTPSLLDAGQMERLMNTLRKHYRITPDAEVTTEANPGTTSLEKLRAYRELGINRISFGVQSFHDDDLKFLSRIHTADEARESIANAHEAGFDNINLDLMFSLPGQTPQRWKANLEEARQLETKHISCYSLTVENGTALATMVRNRAVTMPPNESDALLFERTMSTMAEWGFRQYEISNYALPGYECRHNLGYWRLADYLGFGPSAHGTWNEHRRWNVSNLRSYIEACERKELPIAGGEYLTREMRQEEFIYLRLRSEGINSIEYEARFGSDFYTDRGAQLQPLLAGELLIDREGTIKLSEKGILFADEICTRLA
ncbi:MAG: coproporphyrinogen III oxidase [Ectothiorhodospiraceae bacterium]|nr:coproporphyrinogen III oxidase [Ectothiorhodospiraceae bacterium]